MTPKQEQQRTHRAKQRLHIMAIGGSLLFVVLVYMILKRYVSSPLLFDTIAGDSNTTTRSVSSKDNTVLQQLLQGKTIVQPEEEEEEPGGVQRRRRNPEIHHHQRSLNLLACEVAREMDANQNKTPPIVGRGGSKINQNY
jgi:hypothetical protein